MKRSRKLISTVSLALQKSSSTSTHRTLFPIFTQQIPYITNPGRMKRITLTSCFILFLACCGIAQDYQTFNSARISYFETENLEVRSVRIDSAKLQTDSILFPFAVIHHVYDHCYSPVNASWIGAKVIVKENGDNLFFNKHGDTICIKTKAEPGDHWIAFSKGDTLYVQAYVEHKLEENFLGLVDSVKTIAFSGHGIEANHNGAGLNQMTIKLSKNHGIIKTLNFYLFPDLWVYYPERWLEEYELVGLSEPQVGIKNLTWRDVHDYQVGDQYHILDIWDSWDVESRYAGEDKAIYKYLARTDYTDSIVYRIARRRSRIYDNNGDITANYWNDTVTRAIKADPHFDKLPAEPVIDEYDTYQYYQVNESLPAKYDVRDYEWFGFDGDSCWWMIFVDGCSSSKKYIQGFGGPYYTCDNAFMGGGAERKLVYYQKGRETWGTPLTVSIPEKEVMPAYRAYPNPVRDILIVGIPENETEPSFLEVLDVAGRRSVIIEIAPGENHINLSGISSGIYIYRIFTEQEVLNVGRLVKE